MRVQILGGGVIGTSIACHLATRGAENVVVERSAVARAALGKSGEFLALDWCDGTPLTSVCGISSESPLPVGPDLVTPDDGAIDRLKALCDRMSPVLARAPVLASQACYRPVTADGLPLIGAIPDTRGAYVATGHSVWGILNAKHGRFLTLRSGTGRRHKQVQGLTGTIAIPN
jgi:glycine/D-amino acid oxidase-like deaminating enzyme